MASTETSPHAARYPAGAQAFPHRDLIGIGQLPYKLPPELVRALATNLRKLLDKDERQCGNIEHHFHPTH
jgi:hypothetical protein